MSETQVIALQSAKITESTPATVNKLAAEAAQEIYVMPATQGQLRFWSLDQLNPGNPALNMPLMWKCTGPLHLQAMEDAFSLCVERHEVLRTTFDLVDGRLTQMIHPAAEVPIPLVDLEGVRGDALRREANRITRQHAAFRFDLKHGPLLVLKMIRFDEEHHLLLVSMHHIICDGISNGILMRDMSVFYEALTTGSKANLPELPIQFADFAVWQNDWLQSEEQTTSLNFWRESLGADFSRLNLTRDDDAAAVLDTGRETWTGDIETLLIPQYLQVRAHAFCKRENVTLNILLFTVFAALMYRLTGQEDLTIGSPCANRTEDTEDLIGLFMNIQVMRLRLSKDESFRSLLSKVQEWTLGAYENQSLPFENLVHDPYFSSGSNSFEIPVFFLYQKSFMLTQHIGGLEIVPLRSESPGAVFEMMFAIVDRAEEGPRLQLEYNPHHFKVETIRRYLEMFNSLLESALSHTTALVSELSILGDVERAQLVSGWNGTGVDFGEFCSVVEVFLSRAVADAGRVALECGGVVWTYGRLRAYALGLAGRLVKEGLEPGGLVGICVERSPEMVGAVLAVMLAGGAYVPLDPRHPQERLEMVLEDAGAELLLTMRDLGLRTAAKMIDLSQDGGMDAAGFVPMRLTPESLAYVIYTSGSTGRPKGVAIEQGALMNLLRSMQRTPGLNRDDTLVAITTLAFDIAGLELLLPLLTGAKLVVATDAEVQDGRLLLGLLESSKATVLQATPGAWRILIDAGWSKDLPLKALCGGEALPRELAEKLLDRAGEVWNMYGPTETTIWSSATRVTRGTGMVRIGPPIANTQFYVLDERRQLVPIGVTGELYIGGAGLARGYWKKPELTEEKFIRNPFGEGQIYATGDLARWKDDGTIELLGRTDFQVKIRGYRIELAEIEAAIMKHPAVKETVVTAPKAESKGVTRLIAYLATGSEVIVEPKVLIAEIKATLSRTLPEYLLPNAFVVLKALPRNTNGKLDRKALPNPHDEADDGWIHSTVATSDYFPPRDVIERQLAHIWQSTLGIPRISIRESFFTLGVGSLAALRLITKVNRVFGMDLGLASLISASTIESIAQLIHTRFAPNTQTTLVPLQPKGSKPPLYILHGVGGNVVSFYGLSARVGGDQPVFGIQAQSLLARQPALLSMRDMAAYYVAEIRNHQPAGPYHLLGYSFGGTLAFEMAHQLHAAGEQVAFLGMLDSRTRAYDFEMAQRAPAQVRLDNRLERFRGNTEQLPMADRIKYIAEKLKTRAIRYSCVLAARLHIRSVPWFMKSATDINLVAIDNYQPKPFDGCLVLFRATEQDHQDGPYDLGWGDLFLQGVTIHDLPGDHERLFLEPNIEQLAEQLRQSLVHG